MQKQVALTVDVEDWYQGIFEIPHERWHEFEPRIETTVKNTLRLFKQHKCKGTFFILGAVAKEYPNLMLKIRDAGHEIASHGHAHRKVTEQTKEEFQKDIKQSIKYIKKATGIAPKAYRAPGFSITKDTLWALNSLKKAGFTTDASIFPTVTPWYGIKGTPLKPHKKRGLMEFPMTAGSFFGKRIPFSGGFYLRHLPQGIIHNLMRQTLKTKQLPVMYLHPWELDKKPPKLPSLSLGGRIVWGTRRTALGKKLKRVLNSFPCTSLKEAYATYKKVHA